MCYVRYSAGGSEEQKVSTFPVKEAALGKEGEQEVEEIMWVPSLILFLTWSFVGAPLHIPPYPHTYPHIVSHRVLYLGRKYSIDKF